MAGVSTPYFVTVERGTEEGRTADINLKAYCWDDDKPMRWDVWRLLGSVGYKYVDKTGATNVRIKGQRALWLQEALLLELEWDDHFGKSRRAILADPLADLNAAATDSVGQEFWISTKFMLGILCWWPTWRRQASDRETSVQVLESLLRKTLGAHEIPQLPLDKPPAEIIRMCAQHGEGDQGTGSRTAPPSG